MSKVNDMSAIDHILLATDFCPASKSAADVAMEMAWAFGSRVSVVNAVSTVMGWPVDIERQRAWAKRLVAGVCDRLTAEKVAVVGSIVDIGAPSEVILREANAQDVDLILMGAGDRRGFGINTPGPVAQAVIEQDRQPVLCVQSGTPATTFRNILCPIDGSAASLCGLHNAIRLAKAFKGRLVVLTVVPEPSWLSVARSVPVSEWLAEESEEALAEAGRKLEAKCRDDFDHWLAGTDFQGIDWTREVCTGKPDEQIVAAAQEHRSDLIVMGTHGRSRVVRALLGSVARRVLQTAPCSLLAVKDVDLIEEIRANDAATANMLLAEAQALLAARSYEPALRKFGQVLAHAPENITALRGRAEARKQLGATEPAAR